ncbi:MAG: copper oxidase [Thermoplasmatota archaeon]
MKRLALGLVLLMMVAAAPAASAKVVNENADDLPPGCDEIAGDAEMTVHGGKRFAEPFPDAVYTFDRRSFEHPPCTRLTVTFVNHDDVRHQWMIHDTYPEAFFLIEVEGGEEDTGTVILGSEKQTLLIHCGLPQHQQKGMKGQMLVGGGEGDLPNILGVSGLPEVDQAKQDALLFGDQEAPGAPAALLVVGLLAAAAIVGRRSG